MIIIMIIMMIIGMMIDYVIPSGKLTCLWKITMLNGKTHHVTNGHGFNTSNNQRVSTIHSGHV